jgi:hypothetical protein
MRSKTRTYLEREIPNLVLIATFASSAFLVFTFLGVH